MNYSFILQSKNPKWWLVRHAPVIGVDNKFYGQLDVDCDLSNQAVIQILAKIIPPPSRIITSDLQRTVKTAHTIISHYPRSANLPKPQQLPALREQFCGDWEGKPIAEISNDGKSATDINIFATFADFIPPGGESFITVVERVAKCFNNLQTSEPQPQNQLAVLHAGSIRAILVTCLHLDPEVAQAVALDTLSITILERLENTWRLLAVNLSPWLLVNRI